MGGDRGGLVPPAVAAAAMLVLGWWGIARDNSMGNDEVATRWAALLPLRELAHLLGNVDAVHGLYYLLMHGWVALGSSPAVLRIPSVIAMAVAAVLMVIIGRRLTGSGWAGLFAGLIMVLTPEHQLLRADRAFLRHGVRLRARLDAGPDACHGSRDRRAGPAGAGGWSTPGW